VNTLFSQINVFLKSSFYVVGLVSLSNLMPTPVYAQQATARGSVTLIKPSGSFTSLSGEITVPNAMNFDSQQGFSLTVTPEISNRGSNSEQIDSLSLTVNSLNKMITTNINPVIDGTLPTINNTPNLGDTTTLIPEANLNNSLGLE
jgi:hypothetical protein